MPLMTSEEMISYLRIITLEEKRRQIVNAERPDLRKIKLKKGKGTIIKVGYMTESSFLEVNKESCKELHIRNLERIHRGIVIIEVLPSSAKSLN